MCSIFGQINFSDSLCDSKKFINASDTLRHRGPDSKNYLSDEVNYQFAFNRLAIMDLNHTGSQPMHSQCKRYVCIFNGEIYNYQKIYEEIKDLFKWEGSSDTEVLINAWSLWGEKTLDKITKKIDQIEKMHDKESMLCEEVKDLIEEIRENSLEDEDGSWEEEDADDLEEDFEEDEEEDIDEEDDK